jgi:hypothetical protein
MSTTDLAVVQNQIQTYWSPVFTKRLREVHMLAKLVNKQYQGAITKGGDTVKVSQIVDMEGELLTVGTNADTFDTEQLATTQISVTANKRAVAALEFSDLVELQSQIDQQKVQDTMLFAIEKQINDYLYSLVSPSTSSPDHDLAGTSSIGTTELGSIRQLAGEALWAQDGSWFALMSPAYWAGTLTNSTLSSSLFVDDQPLVAGQKARKLMGFNAYEDNSRTGSYAIFAHPDFLHYVEQQAVQVKISDLHGQGKFGYKMSVDIVFGAALGIQGNVKHIRVTN